MKVLSIIDSFKGTITSKQLNKIVKEELEKKGHEVDCITIADGGDGFCEAIADILHNVKYKKVKVFNPLFEEIESEYLVDEENNTAYIELAKASGINLVEKEKLNPFIASTYGFGQLIDDAIKSNIKKIIVGIGGSATNDGGSGMLEALGVKFFDCHNQEIKHISNYRLKDIKYIDTTDFLKKINNKGIEFITLSDVSNPLLGKTGATYIFSLQKGAKEESLKELEDNMRYFSSFREEYRELKGSGAAGGVGYALHAYFKAKFYPGIDYILDLISFDKIVKNYDYVITGEGKVDIQSLLGKVIFKISSRCPINESNNQKKVIIVCALNDLKDIDLDKYNIEKVYSIINPKKEVTIEESLNNPIKYFRQLVEKEVL